MPSDGAAQAGCVLHHCVSIGTNHLRRYSTLVPVPAILIITYYDWASPVESRSQQRSNAVHPHGRLAVLLSSFSASPHLVLPLFTGCSVPLSKGYAGYVVQPDPRVTESNEGERAWRAEHSFGSIVWWAHEEAPPGRSDLGRKAMDMLEVAAKASVTYMSDSWCRPLLKCMQLHTWTAGEGTDQYSACIDSRAGATGQPGKIPCMHAQTLPKALQP